MRAIVTRVTVREDSPSTTRGTLPLAAPSRIARVRKQRAACGSGVALLIAAMAVVAVAGPVLAKNTLRSGSVRPRTGTTGTTFVFSVRSAGKPTPPATPLAVGGATEPSPSAAAGSRAASDDAGRILPAVLLGLFVILGVGGIALLTGRRQAEERPVPEPGGSLDEPPDPAFVRR